LQIESKVWIPTPRRGVEVNGSATHCSSSGLRMMQIYEDVVRYSVAFLPHGPEVDDLDSKSSKIVQIWIV